MLERRRVLFFTLLNFGRLNYRTNSGNFLMNLARGLRELNQDNSPQQRLLHSIDESNQFLIEGSRTRAIKRANAIVQVQLLENSGWSNPALIDPSSSAAIEARKYAAVVIMNQKTGLDIVSHLNSLTDGVKFPSAESLINAYPYVADCINKTEEFLNQAISIADFSDKV